MARSPALIVLSAALIAVSGARGLGAVADATPNAPGAPPMPLPGKAEGPAPILVPKAEVETVAVTYTEDVPAARYADMAAIYSALAPERAAKLVAGLPTEDGAALLRAMPRDAAGSVLGALDDETAITLTLAMARGAP